MPHTPRQLALLSRKMGDPDVPIPPLKKKRDNPESRMQQSLVDWWRTARKRWDLPEIVLFKITNEGWRSYAANNVMKREGMRTGAADLFLMVPRGRHHGAFIEMKAEEGQTTEAQRGFLRIAASQGYEVAVCNSCSAAMDFICKYLNQ